MVYDFFASRYAACLAGLNRLAPLLRLDMHLAPHLDALYAAVRAPLDGLWLSSQWVIRNWGNPGPEQAINLRVELRMCREGAPGLLLTWHAAHGASCAAGCCGGGRVVKHFMACARRCAARR